MKKHHKPEDFIRQPQYPGGKQALDKFISENLKYPVPALEHNVEGAVHLTYRVDFDGKVVDAKVLGGIGFGCDEEAIRLVNLLQYKVVKNKKFRVSMNPKLTIHFKLPKKEMKVNYTYKNDQGDKDSYNYTVTIE